MSKLPRKHTAKQFIVLKQLFFGFEIICMS